MPIEATKNGVTRIFTDDQWGNMGKDKFGWIQGGNVSQAQEIDPNIIIKKKVADVAPVEIVPAKIPIEIKRKPGRKSNV